MNHAVRSTPTPTLSSRDPRARSEAHTGAGQPPELRLQSVGSERLEVAAVGAFTSTYASSIAQRLTRLVASSPRFLRIDCMAMTAVDPDFARLLAEAATKLAKAGGTLELVDAPAALMEMS